MQYTLVYVGHIQPQQRPRHRVGMTKDGRIFSQTYEASKSRDFKGVLHLMAQNELAKHEGQRLVGPVSMTLTIDLPVPKSFSKKKTAEAMERKIFPTKKPDVDNVLKAVMDALNGVLYEDDKQIVMVCVKKFYGESEGLYIRVEDYEK